MRRKTAKPNGMNGLGRRVRRNGSALRRRRPSGGAAASFQPALQGAARSAAALALLAALALGCQRHAFVGKTMGTTYSVQAACPERPAEQRIAAVLAEVERRMSTYDDESELSRFNRAEAGEPFAVSAPLLIVVAAAVRLAEETGGALDPTVAPLVALWGFGAQARAGAALPTAAEIRAARAQVDYRQVALRQQPPALTKRAPLTLDLSAVAKGYAVDRVAALLAAAGCDSYLVEVGGELRVAGGGPGGRPWRIGVESPAGGEPIAVLAVFDGAVATAGNYRQQRTVGGRRVSHVIDPRSGQPVTHGLASVTVVAPTALAADGYATALLVLGPEAGRRLAERTRLAALFVTDAAAGLERHETAAMARYLEH